jgi:hypothetical protein
MFFDFYFSESVECCHQKMAGNLPEKRASSGRKS